MTVEPFPYNNVDALLGKEIFLLYFHTDELPEEVQSDSNFESGIHLVVGEGDSQQFQKFGAVSKAYLDDDNKSELPISVFSRTMYYLKVSNVMSKGEGSPLMLKGSVIPNSKIDYNESINNSVIIELDKLPNQIYDNTRPCNTWLRSQ